MRQKIRNPNYHEIKPHLVALIVLIAVVGVVSAVESNFGTGDGITGNVANAEHFDTYGKERYNGARYTNVQNRAKHMGEGCVPCSGGALLERGEKKEYTCDGEYDVRVPLIEDREEVTYVNINGHVVPAASGEVVTLPDGAQFKIVRKSGTGLKSQINYQIGQIRHAEVLEEGVSTPMSTCNGEYEVTATNIEYDPFMQAIVLINNKQFVAHPGEKIDLLDGTVMDVVFIEKDKTLPFGKLGIEIE